MNQNVYDIVSKHIKENPNTNFTTLANLVEQVVVQCAFEVVYESTLQSNREVQDFTVRAVNRIKEKYLYEGTN